LTDNDQSGMKVVDMQRLAIVLLLGALGAACSATTRAQAPIERPALEVPPVPPRVIEAAPPPEIVSIEPVSELPPPPPEAKPPRRNSPRETTAKEASKPEVKPETTTTATEPPSTPAAQNVQPAPQLRTPATADTAAAEREVREIVQRARNILNGIDFQRLTPERKKEYQNAKDIADQADTALKTSDFELAKGLAQTAEKLARELR
jgi:hypothetical protein